MSKLHEYPPSSALTPDTYNIVLDGRQCVHVFCPHDFGGKNTEAFLKPLNMELKPECIHRMDNYRHVEETLEDVAKTEDKSLLMLIFWGFCEINGQFILDSGESLPFYKIWSIFCTSRWKNTPKIFLLNLINYTDKVKRDGALFKEFETPNEGDVLIVVKKNKGVEESISYMENLRKKLEEHGAKEDFSSVITTAQGSNDDEPRAVLISTMLKKLFLIPSEHRGHRYSFHMFNAVIHQHREKIQSLLERTQPRIRVDSAEEVTRDVIEQQTESTERRRSSQRSQRSQPDTPQPRKLLNIPQKKKSVTKDKWHYQ